MRFNREIQGGGGKDFLKLKDGESIKGVFRGEPREFRQHWKQNRGVICTGANCPHCSDGQYSSFRFRLNFIVNENGAFTAKIFEQGWEKYDYLRSLHGADYNLERTVVQISRKGTGTDTIYSIVPLPGRKGEVAEEVEAELAKVKLQDLMKTGKPRDAEKAKKDEENEGNPFTKGKK